MGNCWIPHCANIPTVRPGDLPRRRRFDTSSSRSREQVRAERSRDEAFDIPDPVEYEGDSEDLSYEPKKRKVVEDKTDSDSEKGRLQKEARSRAHMEAHLPKNRWCQKCSASKMASAHTFVTKGNESEPTKKFADKLTAETIFGKKALDCL